MREALFLRVGELEGAQVLDLFAGTGALGLEALSRGAAHATFVDRSARALAIVRANLEALELTGRAELQRGDAMACVRRLARAERRFDRVFVDPPYEADAAPGALSALLESGILSDRAMVVVESAKRHPLGPIPGFVVIDERDYGDTRITRLRAGGPEQEPRASDG